MGCGAANPQNGSTHANLACISQDEQRACICSPPPLLRHRQLMREAEHRARFEWGYREMCLEAACCNLDAINFYKRLGYTIVRSDVPGTGATIVETRGFYWEVLPVEKYLMKRRLSGF